MGADDGEAVAGKVLAECNDWPNGPLTGLLRVRPLVRRSSGEMKPIPIVTIVQELAPLLDKNKVAKLGVTSKNNLLWLMECTSTQFTKRAERVKAGVAMLSRYFGFVRKEFKADFDSSESNMRSAKYMAAFVRLLMKMSTTDMLTWDQIHAQLKRLCRRAKQASEVELAFPSESEHVPSRKASVKEIWKFLDECRD